MALVCNFIKGKSGCSSQRFRIYEKKIAHDVATVKSAIANAENNYQFDIDNLFIKEAFVGKSLVMKRYRPRAKGRASPIKKPLAELQLFLRKKKKRK